MLPTPSDAHMRFKGNLFAHPDYFHTDVAKGTTRTPAGTRVCTLTGDFLLGFRDALIYECGQSYRKVMKSAGARWGKQFAPRFDKELASTYGTNRETLAWPVIFACLTDAFAAHGWGRLILDASQEAHGILQVTLGDSVMPGLIPESERPVDQLMAGFLGAIFSHLTGIGLDCTQTDCPSLGAIASRFLIAEPAKIAQAEKWIDQAPAEKRLSHETIVRQLVSPSNPRPGEQRYAGSLAEQNGEVVGVSTP